MARADANVRLSGGGALIYNSASPPRFSFMPTTVELTINLAAIRHNLAQVRRLCPDSRIMAMIKADGYGHGLLATARAVAAADGLAVARLEEALQLRHAGIRQRVLLLGTWLDQHDLEVCCRQAFDVVIHDEASAQLVLARNDWPGSLRIWLKLDSGMHRLGLPPDSFQRVREQLRRHPQVSELVEMMHFSCADEPASDETGRQLRCFNAVHDPALPASVANSAALIRLPECRTGWVRPGIMLYGDNPLPGTDVDLRPAMRFTARVLAVREIGPGEAVGYGVSWRAGRASRIATVGVGYGDGYPRHAASGTPVRIGGRRAPLAGRVSMDSITVDVTDIPPVAVGDVAELWGEQQPVAEVADYAGTISYELLTGVNARVPRRVIDRS